jgi:broad specificity phosphatase PhoE
MKIIVVRHAETNYNKLGLVNYDPNVNVYLTDEGIKQANKLAKELKDRAIDIIIVSDMNRTRQTAEIINQYHHADIISDSRINDIKNGFEGEPVKEYHKKRDSAPDPLNVRFNGGESIMDVQKRTQDFLDDLKKRDEKNILIVTSNNNIKQFQSILSERPAEEIFKMHIENASFFEFSLS